MVLLEQEAIPELGSNPKEEAIPLIDSHPEVTGMDHIEMALNAGREWNVLAHGALR